MKDPVEVIFSDHVRVRFRQDGENLLIIGGAEFEIVSGNWKFQRGPFFAVRQFIVTVRDGHTLLDFQIAAGEAKAVYAEKSSRA